jgi:hypothetical protein
LDPSFFQVALLVEFCYQQIEETVLSLMLDQTRAKFSEHREVKTWIVYF